MILCAKNKLYTPFHPPAGRGGVKEQELQKKEPQNMGVLVADWG
jgi:hypothetical protein